MKKSIKNKNKFICNRLGKFCVECKSAMEFECKEMLRYLREWKPIDSPTLNYLKVLNIQGKERTYTQFLRWFFNSKGEHNLGILSLKYFLERIIKEKAVREKVINQSYKFILKNVTVKAEKALKEGVVPDLTIEGNNFICYVEIKIRAKERRGQTKDYFKYGNKEAEKKKKFPFFIFLRLKEQEYAECRSFINIEWSEVIRIVLKPMYNRAEASTKEILRGIIYNLQRNENKELVEFFETFDEYKENKIQYFIKLKRLTDLIRDKEEV